MSSGIYTRAKYNMMKGLVDLSADTIKVMLLDENHAYNPDHNVIGDVEANEITADTASAYTAGGATLGTPTVTQDDTGNKAVFDGENVEWAAATFTANHAVLWDDSVSDNLICSIDFGGAKTVSAGTFTISWSGDGIIRF